MNSTNVNCNLTKNSTARPFLCLINPDVIKIEVSIMTTELIFSLIGNSLVVLLILSRRFVRSNNRRIQNNKINRMDFFILQLSLADTYVSLGSILTMVIF